MKKFFLALLSVIICAACAFGLTACGGSETTNSDGTPKNMAEEIIDFERETTRLNNLFTWGDNGNTASSSIPMETVSEAFDEGTAYDKYSGFTFSWKKGSKYKITKLEFDITSQTPFAITVDCNFTEPKTGGGKGEYKHLNEVTINNGQTAHIVFDNLSCEYSRFAQSVKFKGDGSTTDKTVLNWSIKVSNLFITAEKV